MAGTFDHLLEKMGVLPKDAPQFFGIPKTTYYRKYRVDFKRDYESIGFLVKLLTAYEGFKKLKSNELRSTSSNSELSVEDIKSLQKRIVILQANLYKLQDQADTELTSFQENTNALLLIDHILDVKATFTKAEKSRISAHRQELELRINHPNNLDFVLKTAKIRATEAEIAFLEGCVAKSK